MRSLQDIRDQAQVCTKTFHQRTASASPVRDVVFCPKKSVLLAAAQENGIVNLWDTRREDRPYRSFQGHSCSILSIDWHPAWDEVNRNWLATAGCRDHLIKVWDLNMPPHSSVPFSTTHNTPAVIYFTRTNNVGQVRWRVGWVREGQQMNCLDLVFTRSPDNVDVVNCLPPLGKSDHVVLMWDYTLFSLPAQSFDPRPNFGRGNFEQMKNVLSPIDWISIFFDDIDEAWGQFKDTTQLISSCSLTIDLSIHLWELERPFIPFVSFEGHTDLVTSLSWSSEPDFFFSTARDGILIRHTYTDGIQPVRQANPVALAVNCHGQLAHAIGYDQLNGLIKSTSRSFSARHFPDQQRIPSPTIPLSPIVNGSVLTADSTKKSSMISSKVFVAGGGSKLFTASIVPDLSLPIESPNTVASLFLPDVLIYLAQNYRFTGSSIDEVCDYNSSVALGCFQYFLSQFWLTLKMIYGRLAQSGVNNPPLKAATNELSQPARKPTNASTARYAGNVRRKKLSAQSTSTATRKSQSRLSVLNLVSPKDHCAEALVNELVDGPEDTSTDKNEQTERSPESLIPSTGDVAGTQVAGSLGESVNFLFSDQPSESQLNSLAPNAIAPESQRHLKNIGSELSEADGQLSQVCPDEAFDLRPRIDPEVISRNSEQNSPGITVEGRGPRNRVQKISHAQGPYRPTEPSSPPPILDGGLDITSSLNCLDLSPPVGSSQSDPYLTTDVRPTKMHLAPPVDRYVDFSHLVGPWFIELASSPLTPFSLFVALLTTPEGIP
ncbi:unnamed protein product [Schistocephalus solidus]|uniref:GATOR2 complex protein WDR24 n=1 Tax=Schistocephalus solidus TaxID=70667 RepID=A0A183S7T6_SCHSO|nr:unnamed protein product [Schistocephalus solidus]